MSDDPKASVLEQIIGFANSAMMKRAADKKAPKAAASAAGTDAGGASGMAQMGNVVGSMLDARNAQEPAVKQPAAESGMNADDEDDLMSAYNEFKQAEDSTPITGPN